MTPELQHRFERSIAPFDGTCVYNSDELSLSRLREILVYTCVRLKEEYPSVRIFRDWHEHDGFIVPPKTASWDFIENVIANDRALFDSRDENHEVRIAIYPSNFDWLLRYNIDEEAASDYTSAICDFDLTIARNAEESGLIDTLLARFPDGLKLTKSQAWFKTNYGG